MRERMAQVPPDAIVLDLMLPGDDGLNLVRVLRKVSDADPDGVGARRGDAACSGGRLTGTS